MTNSRADVLAACLELVADGQLDPADALERCGSPDGYADPLLARAWHCLSHFANDTDIRRGDSDYARQQMAHLREYAKAIRAQPWPLR
jgi:hypothetical protein